MTESANSADLATRPSAQSGTASQGTEGSKTSIGSSIQHIKDRTIKLEKQTTVEMRECGGEPAVRLWLFAKRFDKINPRKPSLRTCLCGTTLMAVVWIIFIYSIVHKHFLGQPMVSTADGHPDRNLATLVPEFAISISEDLPTKVVDTSVFFEYIDVDIKYRTITYAYRPGYVKTYQTVKYKTGNDDCDTPRDDLHNAIVICPDLGAVPYVKGNEDYNWCSKEVETQINSTDSESTYYNETIGNNLTLQGEYGAPLYSFLEITFKKKAGVNMDEMRQNLFSRNTTWDPLEDANGKHLNCETGVDECEREFKMNVWFRFQKEDWTDSNGLVLGEWNWYFYQPLPVRPGEFGLHLSMELTLHTATVGVRSPIADGFLEKKKTESWFSWEKYVQRSGGTGVKPLDETECAETGTEDRDCPILMEMKVLLGQRGTFVTVTHTTVIDSFVAIAAAYEFALGVGVTFAFIILAMMHCKPKEAFKACITCQARNVEATNDKTETEKSSAQDLAKVLAELDAVMAKAKTLRQEHQRSYPAGTYTDQHDQPRQPDMESRV